MIRVVHVLTRTNIGGPSVMLFDLLDGIDKSRVQQTVVRGAPVASEGDYLVGRVVNAEVITIGGLRRTLGVVGEVRSLFALVSTLRRLRPQVVHTHMAKAGVIGRVAAVIARVPVRVHTYHGHLLHGYFSPLVTRIFTSIERVLRTVTTHALVVGAATRRDLLEARVVTQQQSSTIMPAAKPMQRHDRSRARQTLGLPEHGVLVGFVGRLTGIKRPDRFVRLARAVRNATFIVVGNGPLRDETVASAATFNNVTFLDWHDDVSLVLSALDIVVLTSDNEGVPLSLIEAASAGVPVVSTDVGSVREIVEHGVTGFVVSDEHALANAVAELVNDDSLRHTMGERASAHITERCSMRAYLDAHMSLYERLTRE
jgi:glycosyltransferase involved in cell wall biosynthesis